MPPKRKAKKEEKPEEEEQAVAEEEEEDDDEDYEVSYSEADDDDEYDPDEEEHDEKRGRGRKLSAKRGGGGKGRKRSYSDEDEDDDDYRPSKRPKVRPRKTRVQSRDSETAKRTFTKKRTSTGKAKNISLEEDKAESPEEPPPAAPTPPPAPTPPALTKSKSQTDWDSIDLSSDAKTKDGKAWTHKFSSWNVNGVRAWLKSDALKYISQESPDIFCLQETKCSEKDLPLSELEVPGYHSYWCSAQQKGYSGTGMYCKNKPIEVTYGINIDEHDKEGRVITAEFEEFYFVTAYVPNAGDKLKRLDYRVGDWDPDFRSYLQSLDEKKPVILCGDLNVAHHEIDIANPKTNQKSAGFTKEERESFTKLLEECKFVDSFRFLYPDKKNCYSYWSYRSNARANNKGWRLDYFVVSERLQDKICDSIIRSQVNGSDHCPIVLLLAL